LNSVAGVRVCVCVCVCVCVVFVFALCVTLEIVQIVQLSNCPTVAERAASVCFNFSYRQAAASDSLSRSPATSLAIPPATVTSLLFPSAIQF